MSLHLALLIVYSAAIVGVGLWTARLVRESGDFFVAGRRFGPGLIFTTMIAAVGSSRVDLQACKLEYSIVSPK